MTSVPIEILGKALAESINVPVSRLFAHTNGGKGEERRRSLRQYFKAVLWLQDSIVQNYYRLMVRVNNELRRKLNERRELVGIIEGEGFPADPPVVLCAHGFAKDCPTCAHFAKVRAEP